MVQILKMGVNAQAVCQKADTVFDLVHRAGSLPPALSLSIEELLENAWEIAHRKQLNSGACVVELSAYRSGRLATKSRSGAFSP